MAFFKSATNCRKILQAPSVYKSFVMRRCAAEVADALYNGIR